MKLFVPDWDDRVDPGYDFITDRHTLNRNPYRDDLYAHELMGVSAYDGVLISLMSLGDGGRKREAIERAGMRSYLRLPPSLELLGDCGAYSYIAEHQPRVDTATAFALYDRLGFDYGVSVDHLIVPEFDAERHFRYELTLRNAEEFLALHRKIKPRFTPIGAVQGWDVPSYVQAARANVDMGYDYLALGGLARSNTATIASILQSVREVVPPHVRMHIFGVARLRLLALFLAFNVTSVDSAAPLRQAWLSARENYYTLDRSYAAIRIPVAREERSKPQTLIGRSPVALAELAEAEQSALAALRAYDRGAIRLQAAFDAVIAYDSLLADRLDAKNTRRRHELYYETLRDRPWKHCQCPVCRELGVEVIIFRGNNRNRRRGFHNLWVVQQRIKQLSTRPDDLPVLSNKASYNLPLPYH